VTHSAAAATRSGALRSGSLPHALLAGASALALLGLLGRGFAAGVGGSAFGPWHYLALLVLTVLFARSVARCGAFIGDVTVSTIVITIAAMLGLFIFFPVGKSLLAALLDNEGAFAPALAAERLLASDIWGLGCFGGGTSCGVAINSVVLATIVGFGTTIIGLVMALAAQRGGQRFSGVYRIMAVLPIVTPPFVIALALVVLFGRTGLVTGWLNTAFDLPRSRWIYGLPGVTLAQLLSFTPIAFMILSGALAAVSPSLEEAAQTLRASRARVFRSVTWPLLRPALANSFLLGFVESLADFGNPVVLAGNYEVLSTKIFFAVAGAQHEPGRAAALATVLLGFTLIAFWLQQRWLGKASYVTVSGKGDSGLPAPLPEGLRRGCVGFAMAWIVFTLACYAVILVGGFVKDIGRGDMTLVASHFSDGFGIEWRGGAPAFVGSAWDSLFTTIEVAAIAAPLTAPAVRRPARLRVPDHGGVRGAGHRDRRGLHRGLQRAAAGADRRAGDPDPVLRVPQHAGGRARRHRGAGADRQVARRGLVHAARLDLAHAHACGAAAAQARDRGHADLLVHARHDGGQRGDLPGHREVQPGHGLHHRPRRGRRVPAGDCVFHRADRLHAGGAAAGAATDRQREDRPPLAGRTRDRTLR
jgi:ABC-type Fe3+ transport system permease subunit